MKNIFVGNLDFAATDSSVRAMFERYGTVDRVNLVTDRDTGRSRGFAFVEMSNTQDADRAIAGLNGADFEGRALNVNEARPKSQGGGGRGASRAGKTTIIEAVAVHPRRPRHSKSACEEEATMETFQKRQKEMRRLERQRDKAAKRKEIKARKAAGITSESDRDTETAENAAAPDAAADLSTID